MIKVVFLSGAVLGAVVMLIGGAAFGIHAQDPDPEAASSQQVAHAAELAGVDEQDLRAAMDSTGIANPLVYLRSVGELENPPPLPAPKPPPVAAPSYGVWDRLAACESGGRWSRNTGNGYYGGVQFDLPSWRAAGGSGRPDQASRAEQIRVAINWQALAGWKAWPVCSRVIGVR